MMSFKQHLIVCAVPVCSRTVGQLAQDCGWAELEARGATIWIHHLQEFGQIIMGGFRRWFFSKGIFHSQTQAHIFLEKLDFTHTGFAKYTLQQRSSLRWYHLIHILPSHHVLFVLFRFLCYQYERILFIVIHNSVSLAREKSIPEKVFSTISHSIAAHASSR